MSDKQKPTGPARSSEVLPSNGKTKTPAKWRRAEQRLMRLRESLLSEARDLEESACEEMTSFSMHMADAAADSIDRDLALSLLANEQNAIAEVDAALLRIRNGTYGICEHSGKVIPPERLDLIPWARFTAEVQTEAEQQSDAAHPHLNPVSSVHPKPGGTGG